MLSGTQLGGNSPVDSQAVTFAWITSPGKRSHSAVFGSGKEQGRGASGPSLKITSPCARAEPARRQRRSARAGGTKRVAGCRVAIAILLGKTRRRIRPERLPVK
ncbi:MAG: hypothetical protein KatS3mg076_1571 [Candidatus Binatia bacterium]|nr:MAG: hypothetical protein KatS3mg076_1571 [Candidatus Binatia bacterium]